MTCSSNHYWRYSYIYRVVPPGLVRLAVSVLTGPPSQLFIQKNHLTTSISFHSQFLRSLEDAKIKQMFMYAEQAVSIIYPKDLFPEQLQSFNEPFSYKLSVRGVLPEAATKMVPYSFFTHPGIKKFSNVWYNMIDANYRFNYILIRSSRWYHCGKAFDTDGY